MATAYNNSSYTYSGWNFSGDVGTLSAGAHSVTAVAYDWEGNAVQLVGSASITVFADQSPIGWLDTVQNSADGTLVVPQGGSIVVQGWAADQDGMPNAPVSRVEVRIDGQFFGNAALGDARQDVANIYGAGYLNSGWHLTQSIGNLAPGSHTVEAVAYDSSGSELALRQGAMTPLYVTGSATAPPPANGNTLYSVELAYAPNGNVVSANDSVNGKWTFGYDTLNRLTSSAAVGQGYSYAYDPFGNRKNQTVTQGMGFTRSFTYSGNNNRMDGNSYDSDGNVTSYVDPVNGTVNVSYDAENRIISLSGGAVATYLYDAEGRRVSRITSAGTVGYVYDDRGNPATLVNGSNQWTQTELYGMDHVGTYSSTGTFFAHSDWLGSERARTNVSGTLCEITSNLPFGDGQVSQGTCDVSAYHFTGKERDAESGLDYFGARYYGSNMGRMMSPDWSAKPEPIPYAKVNDPQSLNLYIYVGNNPLSRTDPTGHYGLNESDCDTAKCQKKWDKAANKFEARRQKNLRSKNPDVRAAAAAYGARGEENGVHVGFGNLNTGSNPIYGSVDASGSTPGNPNIQVTLDFGRAGNAETETHEGTHVKDDLRFLNSYDPSKGGYDQSLNPTHGQTEFNAFKAGAAINREHGFGPNDTQKILDFLHNSPTYGPVFNIPVFDPARFPGQ